MPVHCHFNDAKTNEFVPLRLVNLELRGCLDPRAKTEGKDAESDELDLLLWVGIAYVMRKERLIETEGKSEEEAATLAANEVFGLSCGTEYEIYRRKIFAHFITKKYSFCAYRT
jgi:hypothetical protein